MKWFLFVAALYALPGPLTLTIYPYFSNSPATFRVTVMAPRHAGNRLVCWSVDGPEFRKSCHSLDGENAQKVWTVYWSLRTAGDYVAEAVLTRVEDGQTRTYKDSHPFRVIGFELEP